MITLAAGGTLQATAGSNSTITCTVTGLESSVASGEVFKVLDQRVLTTSVVQLYVVPAGTTAFVKTILLANTTGGSATVTLYVNGTGVGNQIASLPVPANGEATFDASGWKVYNAAGALVLSLVTATTTPGTTVTDAAGIAGSTGLASDAGHTHQHGSLSTTTDHAVATTALAGFMAAADKLFTTRSASAMVLVQANPYSNLAVDGSTDDLAALNALISAVPDKSVLVWPPGTMVLTNAVSIPSGKHLHFVGAGPDKTYFQQRHQTADHFTLNDWQNTFEGISFTTLTTTTTTAGQTPGSSATINVADASLFAASGSVSMQTTSGWQTVAYTSKTSTTLVGCTGGVGTTSVGGTVVFKTAGYAINGGSMSYIFVRALGFNSVYNGFLNNATLCGIEDSNFSGTINFDMQFNGTNVNSYVHNVTADGLPNRTASIEVNQCGSLLISDCDLIRATNNLRVNPTSPNGCFGIYAINSYFDTAGGSSIKYMGTGNIQRVKFINCWLSGGVNGFESASTAATLPTATDFTNCDVYSNSANGFLLTAIQDISINQCRIAGNVTAGISAVAAAGGVTSLAVYNSRIGPTGGIGVNGTGVLVAAGTYKSVIISSNNLKNNTTNATIGAVVVAAGEADLYRITDNGGYNPLTGAAVTTPAIPASTVVVTNTTGRRVLVMLKNGATTMSSLSVNGVVAGVPVTASQLIPVTLEPGGTINFTYTVAPTWVWIGQ
jgi:hypothetical protein